MRKFEAVYIDEHNTQLSNSCIESSDSYVNRTASTRQNLVEVSHTFVYWLAQLLISLFHRLVARRSSDRIMRQYGRNDRKFMSLHLLVSLFHSFVARGCSDRITR